MAHGNCYIRGFPSDWQETDLLKLAGAHGDIVSVRMVPGGGSGTDQLTGGQTTAAPHAFVKYAQPEQVRTL
jgi:hypothetical protein